MAGDPYQDILTLRELSRRPWLRDLRPGRGGYFSKDGHLYTDERRAQLFDQFCRLVDQICLDDARERAALHDLGTRGLSMARRGHTGALSSPMGAVAAMMVADLHARGLYTAAGAALANAAQADLDMVRRRQSSRD